MEAVFFDWDENGIGERLAADDDEEEEAQEDEDDDGAEGCGGRGCSRHQVGGDQGGNQGGACHSRA